MADNSTDTTHDATADSQPADAASAADPGTSPVPGPVLAAPGGDDDDPLGPGPETALCW
jgi:hypothetical protein